MKINLVLIPFIIIFGLLMSGQDNKRNRGFYIVSCSLILLFIAVFRSPEWFEYRYYIDTLTYKELFEANCDLGWKEFWNMVLQSRLGNGPEVDIGYFGIMAIFGRLTHSYYFFSFFTDLFFFIPLCIILYRYGTSMQQLIFAFVFFISFMLTGLIGGGRQTIAIGFDLMAFLCVIDRKKWKAILFFLIGFSIHKSSLVFLIPLLMIWFNVNPKILKIIHIVCFALVPLALVISGQIIVFFGNLSGVERYANYGAEVHGGATTFIILIEFLSLFCLVSIKKADLQNNSYIRFFYVMAPLFTIFAPLIIANGAMIRLSAYYHYFLVLLVPIAINCMFKDKHRNIVYFIAILALAYLTVSDGGMEYYFYWQYPGALNM